jgi:hypothetical protein
MGYFSVSQYRGYNDDPKVRISAMCYIIDLWWF